MCGRVRVCEAASASTAGFVEAWDACVDGGGVMDFHEDFGVDVDCKLERGRRDLVCVRVGSV